MAAARKSLLFLVNHWGNGAIPNILLDVIPPLGSLGWDIAVSSLETFDPLSPHALAARELGVTVEDLGVSSRSVAGALGAIARCIRSRHPDLVHTHLGRADIYTPWVKGSVPQVTTFHSVYRNYSRLTRWGYRLSDRRVSHRTGVSQAALDSFYGPGYLHSPSSVVYNPVNPARFVPQLDRAALQERVGLKTPGPLLVHAGRLIEAKGQHLLVEAMAMLSDRPDMGCIIAGEGPLRADLQARIDAAGLQDRMVLAGNWPCVADLYAAGDLLVFPSRWEGLGLVPLEALSMGCPVLASDIPAVTEYLQDGDQGILFRDGDAAHLAGKIRWFLNHADEARQMAARGREMVVRRFSPDAIAREYDRVYRSVPGIS